MDCCGGRFFLFEMDVIASASERVLVVLVMCESDVLSDLYVDVCCNRVAWRRSW